MNHEAYINLVASKAIDILRESAARRLAPAPEMNFRLVYGAGTPGVRGVTYFDAWQNGCPEKIPFVEICAMQEEDKVQLAGTTIHEVGHVLAGCTAGHGKEWKEACRILGLRKAKAAGMKYCGAALHPQIRELIDPITLEDGTPGFGLSAGSIRPCGAGVGTRGGKSRGKGSGSRSLKLECPSCGYVVRTTRKWLEVGLPTCCCGVEFQEVTS